MQLTKTYRTALAGLLVALGILLPYFTAHMFGLPGTVLLPMHIPVFLIGLLCGPGFGLACGLMIPLLSSLFTGMPPAFPMLPIMAGELMTYGLLSGLLYQKTKRIYLSMLPAMLCGRVVYGLIFALLTLSGGEVLRALSVSAAFVQGLPGIAIQLVLVPVIVRAALHGRRRAKEANSAEPVAAAPSQLDEAKARILQGSVTCIVLQNGQIVREASGNGVKPVLGLLETERDILLGAAVVDKIIGKAAAMLLVLGGASYAYGELMSSAGRDYLEQHGITAEYGRCISVISNRDGDAMCPLERSVLNIDDPEEGYQKLKETIRELMSAM